MRKLGLALAVVFFFLNPGLACGPSDADEQYQFGAVEMRAAIEGDWLLTITPTGGDPAIYHLHLQQADGEASAAALPGRRGLVRAAHACGSRTLVASAQACTSISNMPLTVTLAPGDPPASGTPSGKFWVAGTQFGVGYLDLVIGDYPIDAHLRPDGTVTFAAIAPLGGPTGTATLARQ